MKFNAWCTRVIKIIRADPNYDAAMDGLFKIKEDRTKRAGAESNSDSVECLFGAPDEILTWLVDGWGPGRAYFSALTPEEYALEIVHIWRKIGALKQEDI